MPTKKQLRLKQKDDLRIPGGNELPKGSKRPQTKSQWEGVKSPSSIWEKAEIEIMRSSLGTSWGIKKR
jgi:hypothetical protein